METLFLVIFLCKNTKEDYIGLLQKMKKKMSSLMFPFQWKCHSCQTEIESFLIWCWIWCLMIYKSHVCILPLYDSFPLCFSPCSWAFTHLNGHGHNDRIYLELKLKWNDAGQICCWNKKISIPSMRRTLFRQPFNIGAFNVTNPVYCVIMHQIDYNKSV